MPNLDRDYYLDKQGLHTLVNELEKNIVAEEFSSSATYNLGDYCIYSNLLYICTTPVTTAGSWTGSTNWLQVLIGDELSEKTEIQTITLAQWEALTPDQKASGDYVISDATLSPLSASLMPYDNTISGLAADDVQGAIDEIASGGIVGSLNDLSDVTISNVQDKQELVYNDTNDVFENKTTRIELTQAQYDALANPLPDVDYYITDAPSMSGSSKDLSYDGTALSTYNKIEDVASDVSDLSDNTYTKSQVDSFLSGKASKSLIDVYQSKSGSPALVTGIGGYATVIVIGFAQSVGAIAVLIKIDNSAISSQIDMSTGSAFSKPQVTFTYSSGTLTITTTNANTSTFTVIKGGL